MKTLRSVAVCLCMVSIISAHLVGSYAVNSHAWKQASNQSAHKFDEYGDLIQDDEGARLDAFENELKRKPDSRAYIIAYGGQGDPLGKARRYALRARAYLVEARGIAGSRVVPVDGGRRENLTVELWLVPVGARPPTPTPTVTMEQREANEARKYDEYSYGYGESWNRYEDASIRLDGFAAALQREPGSRGYIVAYAQNGDDRIGIECDPAGLAQRIASLEKRYLVQKQHIDPTQVAAVNGGYSPTRTVELWIIPHSAPAPTVRPMRCR